MFNVDLVCMPDGCHCRPGYRKDEKEMIYKGSFVGYGDEHRVELGKWCLDRKPYQVVHDPMDVELGGFNVGVRLSECEFKYGCQYETFNSGTIFYNTNKKCHFLITNNGKSRYIVLKGDIADDYVRSLIDEYSRARGNKTSVGNIIPGWDKSGLGANLRSHKGGNGDHDERRWS